MERLREGRSRIVEENHHLVIGWTDKCCALVKELTIAMESQGGGVVVLLSEE